MINFKKYTKDFSHKLGFLLRVNHLAKPCYFLVNKKANVLSFTCKINSISPNLSQKCLVVILSFDIFPLTFKELISNHDWNYL